MKYSTTHKYNKTGWNSLFHKSITFKLFFKLKIFLILKDKIIAFEDLVMGLIKNIYAWGFFEDALVLFFIWYFQNIQHQIISGMKCCLTQTGQANKEKLAFHTTNIYDQHSWRHNFLPRFLTCSLKLRVTFCKLKYHTNENIFHGRCCFLDITFDVQLMCTRTSSPFKLGA